MDQRGTVGGGVTGRFSEAGVAAVRRRLLERILTERTPRGDVTPPVTAAGVEMLGEALEMRRELDDALRAGNMDRAEQVRARARELLAEETR